MSDHKTPEGEDSDIEQLLSSKEVVRHLLRGCGACQRVGRQGFISLEVAAKGEAEAPELSAAYDVALDRVMGNLSRSALLPRGEQWRFQKASSLLRSGGGVLALAKTGRMSVEGLGVYEALLARSWSIRYDDHQAMCHLAKVAVEMSEGFNTDTYGVEVVADLRARAWGELANAYRVADRLRESEIAFGKAFDFFRQGSQDRDLRMRLLDLEASLLGTLRQFPLALQRLTVLSHMYQADGEPHLAGRALVTKALYTFYRGNTEEACQTIAEGLALIDRKRDPSLALVAAFDQLLFLVDCGRFKEAKRALFRNRPSLTKQGRIAMLKLRGIEGRIFYGLGELRSAEVAIRETKQGFAEAGMGFAGALVGLDLAMILFRQERRGEAVKEVLEAATMFRVLSVHRELLGTAMLLEETFRAQTADLALLEVSAQYLRKKMMELGLG
jgi:tetratricopeptide (TPR) repeat protein